VSANGKDDPKGDGPAEVEEKGLAGVDVEPMPPLDREGIEALRRERDDLQDQLLRKRAEFENYRKRVERDRQQSAIDAKAAVLKALFSSLDDLDRALSAKGGEASLRGGLELIRRDLDALLESQGVTVLDPKGQKFDPEAHQALSHEHVPGFPEDTVTEVLRKGYTLKDRLLRPALVKVAKDADGESENGSDLVH